MNAIPHHNVQRDVNPFVDQFGRHKRKLRISVTDRCNFKCVYCMPEHPEWMKKQDLLSFEALYQFCEFMVRRGIEHIRITGGEPLMRQGVVHFIAELQQLKKIGLKKVSMTTNAHYLKQYASQLKQAGLDDLNISLDSLDAEQFKHLTKKDLLPVLEGIQQAKAVGLPIKINTVLIRGVNDDQILPLAHWSIQNNVMVRFIEFMPLDGDAHWSSAHVVTEQDILRHLKQDFDVTIKQGQSSEPARTYFIHGFPIGIISTISNSFCGTCDRLRLTAKGEFFNCLFATQGLDLKKHIQALMQKKAPAELKLNAVLTDYIWHKKQGFDAIQQEQTTLKLSTLAASANHAATRKISMYMIGG
ncbi:MULTISPECIES: GTP 3',8-cyclase MoaA [Acinetobacter]|uniref:GTP 3',8-cyclase n=1 Tax=Acinetobacter piscicola TaxID=2006115 RepID=A0A7S7AHA7_9GAMM|nr:MULTISPECIES: GTP 3',8-cyclase MoaA [Acinetobacter]QOW45481.1 GTP 3',8-cyclase MoaA [Acinetobacter piscicola]